MVAEGVAADGGWCRVGRVELGGLEPPASGVPRRRSGQLSYSPFEIEVVSKVNAWSLSVFLGGKTQPECVLILDDRYGNQKTAIELRAIHADHEDDRLFRYRAFCVCARTNTCSHAPRTELTGPNPYPGGRNSGTSSSSSPGETGAVGRPLADPSRVALRPPSAEPRLRGGAFAAAASTRSICPTIRR